jgi:hypothetical protein
MVLDSVLDELAADLVERCELTGLEAPDSSALPPTVASGQLLPVGTSPEPNESLPPDGSGARLFNFVLAAGLSVYGAALGKIKDRLAGRLSREDEKPRR